MSNIDEVLAIITKDKEYFSIDYSNKIKTIDEFQLFVQKTMDRRYIKFIFKIDFRVIIANSSIFQKISLINLKEKCYNNQNIVLFNRDNYLFISSELPIQPPFIRKFLNGPDYSEKQCCVICDDDDSKAVCSQCFASHCRTCLIKMKLMNKLECSICKNDFKDLIKFIPID